MVYLKEQRFTPREGENQYDIALRNHVESYQPFKDSSVMFQAYTPVASNPLDSWAPSILAVMLLGFFFF